MTFFTAILVATSVLFTFSAGAVKNVIASEDSAGPWGNHHGQGAGNEVVIAAYKAVNIEAELRVMPYKRAKGLVMAGRLPGCFAMSWEPELEGKVIFSREPLYKVNVDFYGNSTHLPLAKSLDDLKKGSTVGIVAGYEYPKFIEDLKKRGIVFEEGRTEENNLKKLALDRMTYTILMTDDLKSGDVLLKKIENSQKIKLAFRSASQGAYLGFSLNHPQGPYAKTKFDQGFQIIKKNGEFARILKKWKRVNQI